MSFGDTVMMEDDEPASQPARPAGLQGLLEVFDRNGATVARLPVSRWPMTVGRALDADLVLDDVHVAAQHLRIEAGASGHVVVQVLDTLNGVRCGKTLHQRAARFDWPAGEDLVLGRLRLRLRLPGMPVAPEQRLPQLPWRTSASTVVLVLFVVALALVQTWFKTSESARFAQAAVSVVGAMLGALLLWAGLWALVTKLFAGHPHFWRHVRIVCAALLADTLLSGTGYLMAFAFSWESLARFNFLLSAPVTAAALSLHLLVMAPQRRKAVISIVVGITLLGTFAIMGSSWLQNKRLSNQLFMSAIFPPNWRLAATVPVDTLIRDAATIRQRLDERLKDGSEDENSEEEED